jgi:hypothetical protein
VGSRRRGEAAVDFRGELARWRTPKCEHLELLARSEFDADRLRIHVARNGTESTDRTTIVQVNEVIVPIISVPSFRPEHHARGCYRHLASVPRVTGELPPTRSAIPVDDAVSVSGRRRHQGLARFLVRFRWRSLREWIRVRSRPRHGRAARDDRAECQQDVEAEAFSRSDRSENRHQIRRGSAGKPWGDDSHSCTAGHLRTRRARSNERAISALRRW